MAANQNKDPGRLTKPIRGLPKLLNFFAARTSAGDRGSSPSAWAQINVVQEE